MTPCFYTHLSSSCLRGEFRIFDFESGSFTTSGTDMLGKTKNYETNPKSRSADSLGRSVKMLIINMLKVSFNRFRPIINWLRLGSFQENEPKIMLCRNYGIIVLDIVNNQVTVVLRQLDDMNELGSFLENEPKST